VLEAGWQRYGPEVAFVGIAVNDEADAAKQFIRRYGKTYHLGSDVDGSAAVDYGLYGVPETFFIGRDGTILSRHIGPLTAEDLDQRIAELEAGVPGETRGDPASGQPLSIEGP
jgi:cytochrome c biogenesis protein CcmG/thiol:disulfide interchange protein DsbE